MAICWQFIEIARGLSEYFRVSKEQDMVNKYRGDGSRVDEIQSPTGDGYGSVPKKTYTPTGCLVAVHLFPQSVSTGGIIMPETTLNGTTMRSLPETARCLV